MIYLNLLEYLRSPVMNRLTVLTLPLTILVLITRSNRVLMIVWTLTRVKTKYIAHVINMDLGVRMILILDQSPHRALSLSPPHPGRDTVRLSVKTFLHRSTVTILPDPHNSPHARTLNMVKKIPRQFGQWNPLETPICFNMPVVLKEFLGPFLRKCILKN